ncbi:MAG: transglycosylase domain-containing protein [Erysipelotrichaceae bacterium]|nr:transglycosylase domain-containing protein [Erysipelotrichaceae bacterium]
MAKKQKTKRKANAVDIWATIISVVAVLALIGVIAGIGVIFMLLQNKPALNLSDFDQAESSVIYDSKGEEIANLGTVIRQNIEFDEIPNCVVDAFVAVEDSRFFEHNGFDLPRFTKAFLENIRTLSFGQGGSTFTMQLVKNTYFTNDETGEEAARSGARGIRRKVQEIALAMELEKAKSKQDIFESYLNKLNFGGNNIRGIQKASQYYFGKDISECGLVEGALLAGVINAPNYYNPFYNLEEAQDRTLEVLYQMKNHGYISQQEYDLAKSVRIEDLLNDPYSSTREGEGIPYQAYVDAVVSEVISLTGLDPYSTTMHIYTHMNKDIQEQMDRIQAGDMDGYLEFPDPYFECASICIKNSTGEIVGILGGRNYAYGGQLLLNHATEQYKQPGSSIKPILDYALAFENLGWATDHVLTDRPMWLDSTNQILVYNDSGTYVGDVTLSQALGQSINTCAIQTMQQVLSAKKYEYVVNYAQSLGYDFNLDDFNVQYAVGGSTCEVTPLQHAAAYAGIMNYGVYHTPHTIERIEFTNGKSPITPVYESKQVLSEAASYLTAELMRMNVENYGGTYTYVKNGDYTVYGKTGTTDYGTSGSQFGIPSGAIKDGWLVAATSEYTTATWVGYERAVLGQQSYITQDFYYNQRPQGKIAHLILDSTFEFGDTAPRKLERPSGVTSITHVIGTWPYAAYTEDMDPSLRTTGQIKSDSVKLVSLATPTVKNLEKFSADLDGYKLKLKWAEYPEKNKTEESTGVKDISLIGSDGNVVVAASGTNLFDYTKLYGPIKYMADITVEGRNSKKEHVAVGENEYSKSLSLSPGDKVTVEGYYAYEKGNFTSNKEKKTFTVSETLTFPANGSSLTSVNSWASAYSYISVETVKDDFQSGTFTIRDSDGKTYDPGATVIVDSNITFTITYYVDEEHTLDFAVSTNESGTAITVSASFDGGSEFSGWDYSGVPDGVSVTQDGTKLRVSVSEDSDTGSFIATASTDKMSKKIRIVISQQDGSITVSAEIL